MGIGLRNIDGSSRVDEHEITRDLLDEQAGLPD